MFQTNFELGLFNAYLLMLFYFVVSMIPFLFKNSRTKEISPTNIKDDFGRVIYLMSFIVFAIAIIVSLFLPIIFESIFFYIGIILYIIGVIIVASVCISWIKTPKEKPVTKGIYKYSRNPMYLSFFFVYTGIGIATTSWVFLMLTAVYIAITILFVDYEEKFCIEKYGDKYKEYMKNTARWISFSKNKNLDKMKKIGLITALEFEVPDQLNYKLSNEIQAFQTKEYEIAVIVSGVGQKKAINATRKLCKKYKPDMIIYIGFCGGVIKECKTCDLFLADSICYNDEEIKIDKKTLDFVKQKLSEYNIKPEIGKFQTFDDVVLSKKDIASDVIAVEMESFGAVKEAKKYKTPMILVRTVSDIIPDKKPIFAKIKAQKEFIKNIGDAKKTINDFFEIFEG